MPIMSDVIVRSMSRERFQTYYLAADENIAEALQLYLWNAEAGAAFHLPIQAVEVSLRNRINTVMLRTFGAEWWSDDRCNNFLGARSIKILKSTTAHLKQRKNELTAGDLVGSVSFGFWVTLARRLPQLVLPELTRAEIVADLERVHQLRNRIAHHEPIFRRDLLADYGIAMRLLRLLCPATHDWIRPHCRVPQLVRRKP